MFKNLLIGVAVFGLGWGASFGAGAAWGRRSVAPPVQAQVLTTGQAAGAGQGAGQGAAGVQGQTPGQGAGAGAGAGAGPARPATTGTVDRIDGQTLLVAGPGGQQVRVTLAEGTQITRQAPGTPADLTPGARVAVVPQGQPGADGAVTAAAVTLLPEGAPAPGQAPGQAPGGAQRRPGG